MPSTEAALSKKIVQALKAKGAWAVKNHVDVRKRRGQPDIHGCYRGWFLGLEVKLPGKEKNVTKLQESTLRGIEEAGGFARVVTSRAQALAVLEAIDRIEDG